MTATGPAQPHGRPTAAELVAAVAEFLESDVRAALCDDAAARGDVDRVNFHLRVAANVLRTVERELTHAGPDGPALADLGVSDEAQLAAVIRDGRLDDRACEVLPALRRLVSHRLAVAHPGYAITSIADRMFAAMEAGDTDAVAAMWSPEITVWRVGTARRRDTTRARRVIDWFVSASADRHYDVLARELFEHGFVQQHLLHGHCRDGTPYSLRTAIIVVVGSDGLITRIDEYFDPADLAPLLDQHNPRWRS
jgi:ketosteroid isomerase-like protein